VVEVVAPVASVVEVVVVAPSVAVVAAVAAGATVEVEVVPLEPEQAASSIAEARTSGPRVRRKRTRGAVVEVLMTGSHAHGSRGLGGFP
jgi:hypothetical protein